MATYIAWKKWQHTINSLSFICLNVVSTVEFKRLYIHQNQVSLFGTNITITSAVRLLVPLRNYSNLIYL